MELMIFTSNGQRKYLTSREMSCFISVARRMPLDVQTFCLTIAYTGCRISEALALTRSGIDFEARALIIKCLKKRGKLVYRSIPLPGSLLDLLRRLTAKGADLGARLWPWSRMTGYRRICEVMEKAGIAGEHATPKGLRHGFAVQAIQSNVPLTLVQRWLGHANLKTTAIYTSAMGAEERKLAERMWSDETLQAESRKSGDTSKSATAGRNSDAIKTSRPRSTHTEQSWGVTYRLRFDADINSNNTEIIPPVSNRKQRESARRADGSKKTLLNHLLGCTLIHFWLKGNSKNPYNVSG